MNIERQLLHNLAIRLRFARKQWRHAIGCDIWDYKYECEPRYFSVMIEAQNSFQAAKSIYNEHLRELSEAPPKIWIFANGAVWTFEED